MKSDGVLGDVGHEDGQDVALGEPAGGKAGGEGAHALRELGVGDLAAAGPVDQGGLVAEFGGVLQHEVADRDVWDLHVGLYRLSAHISPSVVLLALGSSVALRRRFSAFSRARRRRSAA